MNRYKSILWYRIVSNFIDSYRSVDDHPGYLDQYWQYILARMRRSLWYLPKLLRIINCYSPGVTHQTNHPPEHRRMLCQLDNFLGWPADRKTPARSGRSFTLEIDIYPWFEAFWIFYYLRPKPRSVPEIVLRAQENTRSGSVDIGGIAKMLIYLVSKTAYHS